jgi:hypothetical protein
MWINPFKRFFNTQDPPQDSRPTDSYFEKLLRYIPADIVAAYLTLDGVLRSQTNSPDWLPWSVFGVMFVLTPFYVVFMKSDPPGFAPSKNFHWMASLFAFTVWVFALDGSFAQTFDWYKPVYGSICLVITTLIMPLAERLFLKLVPNTIPGTTPGSTPNTPPTPPAPPVTPSVPPAPPATPPVVSKDIGSAPVDGGDKGKPDQK